MIKKMVRGAVTEPLHRPKPTQSLVTLTSLPQSLSTSLKNPLNRVSLVSLTLSNLKTKMETEIKENKLGSPLAISQRFKVSKDAQRSNGESSRMAFECSELEFSLFDDGFRKVNIRLGFNSGIPQGELQSKVVTTASYRRAVTATAPTYTSRTGPTPTSECPFIRVVCNCSNCNRCSPSSRIATRLEITLND
ncbi:uncharacterized protein LOC127107056 isoform X1 [Lathyrus oleraceus]|uniref:uncharacterized protein LOC127107056 isoform X1 n=1 Tax=Pisum sativum TaxID=3888 RepID=UPI0021D2B033|nr:uncharacterized protein LOC127107056 isoform X1 [Pisum sativum]XP_050900285.1 uncharacterized protein LOC127107056 isoform X1 [Pisum sativum]XP_050900287.1 uncharacterized protein LOC127107056 isoform X1 [Pisum sativum]XP_050900288.1 uncharacterized protein LOC127107056 isoform X1 [Pisum sativum]XP_050900289.1 uncharacterized protein LOC127107056 isoform X1 [Pisum sativum]